MASRNHRNYAGEKSFPARLQSLVKAWKSLFAPALKHRQKMLKLYASGFYDMSHSNKHIINLTDRGISTIVPFLVEGDPKILVTTQIPSLSPFAYTTQLALNFLIKKLKLAENVLIPVATNSMFGLGVTYTSSTFNRTISFLGEEIKTGIPHVSVIDDANYIGDPSANHRSNFGIEGDIFRLPTDYAKEFFAGKDKNGNQIADYIKADCKLHQDFSSEEITRPDFDKDQLALKEYTTFINLHLRDSNTQVIIMPEGQKAKILRETEYKGPGDGPYDVLAYKYFPDSPIPLPPAWSWHDMDVSINNLLETMQEQAESQKDLVVYPGAGAKDAERIEKAPNTGIVRVENPEALKAISFGGVNPLNFQWVQYIEQEHNKQGASPEVLGGRGASAPTLGQEQLIYNNATRVVNNMYTRFLNFTESIVNKLAWEFWTNPTIEVPVVKEIPGVIDLPVVYSQQNQVGDFYDFVFNIQPYSTQRTNPQIQYQRVMQLMTQWVLPTMQLAQAQGATIDVPLVSQILADYIGADTFRQWYKSAVPTGLETMPGFKMEPFENLIKNAGQTNDTFGATEGNQNANLNRSQTSGQTGQPL